MSAWIWLAACSLGPRPGECVDDAGCRQAFGFGSRCGGEGYCVQADDQPRCDASYPEDLLDRPEQYGDALVLVTLFQQQYDQPQRQGAELAVREVADEGALDGRPVVILHCDNDERPDLDTLSFEDATATLASYAVEQLGAQALIGPATSDTTLIAYEAVGPLGAVVISPSASSPLLTTADGATHSDDDPGLLWRTVPPDDLQAFVMVDDLRGRGVQAIALIDQTGAYGTALGDAVETQFQAAGGTVQRFSYANVNERNLATLSAGQAAVEEVVFVSSEVQDIVEFVNAVANSADYLPPAGEAKRLFLADAGADPYLLANASAAAVSDVFPLVRGTRPQVPQGSVYDLFEIAYAAAWNGEDASAAVYSAYAYDAAWLALYGAAWATFNEPAVDGLGIAKGMRRTTGGVVPYPVQASSWEGVVEAFRAGDPIDVSGASGPLDFDPITGEVSNPIEVWTIEGGSFVPQVVCQPGGACAPAG